VRKTEALAKPLYFLSVGLLLKSLMGAYCGLMFS
jgi:hypothetical protein